MERILILVIVGLLFAAVWLLLRWYLQVRFARMASEQPGDAVHELVNAASSKRAPGEPALLYFTTEDCAQCRFQQTPILQRLAERTRIPIIVVDAVERMELARQFGILTVPSTVLLDARLAPVAINHGVARLDKLSTQISAIETA